MNLTIFAAIVIAIAGIAGILVMNELLKAASAALARTEGKLTVTSVEARAAEDIVRQMKAQLNDKQMRLAWANIELEQLRAASPRYGRDPKTGRFKKVGTQ